MSLDDKFNSTHGGTIYYALEVERVNWKSLDKEARKCYEDQYDRGTTKCITNYVERETGCQSMLPKSDSNLPYCTTPEEIALLLRRTRVLRELDENEMLELTGCLATCDWNEFRPVITQPACVQ